MDSFSMRFLGLIDKLVQKAEDLLDFYPQWSEA